jgi:hypothetical protein
MRAVLALLCLLAFLPLAGCEENRDPATPDGALHQLRDAVLAHDAAALLALSSAETRKHLDELHALVKGQATRIAKDYPPEHQQAARSAYPAGVLEAADAPALFAALVGPQLDKLEPTKGLRWGLTSLGAPSIDGDRASVSTQSGETLEFVREDGQWRTTAFEQHLQANVNRLKLNQQTLDENLAVFQELARRAAAKQAAEAGAAAAPGSGPAAASGPARSP